MTDEKEAAKEVVDLNSPKPTKIIAVDVGTMNIVLAEQSGKSASISSIRNMYLPLDKSQVTMAELSNIDYVETEESVYIIGNDAFNFSNIFGKSVKRPMSKGLISPDEIDSLDILELILEKLAGKTTDGKCVYSVPAPSIDSHNNVTYHEGVFHRIFTDLGYYAQSFNEAMAIIYSHCQDEQFSGLAFSFGAGMVNVCLAYKSVPAVTFSVARSGDWIDENVAMSLGTVPNRITAIKEKNTDLSNYLVGNKKERRIREAITYYYREMIRYSLDQIKNRLSEATDDLQLPDSLSVIVSGGTSMATGFLPLFKEILGEYVDSFGFEVKDVKHADDPLTAVAEGLLVKAISEYGS
jgi:hypothetical protein